MSTVEDIKTAIIHLSEEELRELRTWYEQFDTQQWDAQLASDVAAGHLDALADAAIRAFETGRTTEL